MSAWDTWIRWLTGQGAEQHAWSPPAALLGMLLQAREAERPTAALASYNSLKWLTDVIGIPLPMHQPGLRDFRVPKEGHLPRPAEELQPEEFWNLWVLMQSGRPRWAQIAEIVLFFLQWLA